MRQVDYWQAGAFLFRLFYHHNPSDLSLLPISEPPRPRLIPFAAFSLKKKNNTNLRCDTTPPHLPP
ncbi:hypothetical protein, partial [Escherichia coli]|uniref:hypothetical protein n=1 Tax=Escherichia coli TaxID=562 RepID=UPI00197ADE5C